MEQLQLFPLAPVLIESTRSIGYSFEAAIADILDNSISAQAKNIMITYQSFDHPFVCIKDDGYGMTKEELETAMRYGSKSSLELRKNNDLGRFGLGLKVSSLSQCRKLTVISKKQGYEICGSSWDLNLIQQKQDWILGVYSIDEIHKILNNFNLSIEKEGTIILWEDFDRLSNTSNDLSKIIEEKMEQTKLHLSLVFHKYLSSDYFVKTISIYVNNEKLKPSDPFLIDHPSTQKLEVNTLEIDGEKIIVKPYILPHANKLKNKDIESLGKVDDLRRNQGFYIYRNKRLIIWGTWFRLHRQNELNNLARVSIEIPNTLDHIWEIDIKKSTATLPDLIRRNLQTIVNKSLTTSEKVYKYRGRKEKSDEIQHIWEVVMNRGKFSYQINKETELYKYIENLMPVENIHSFNQFIKLLEERFPYDDVYYRYSKNAQEFEKSTSDEKEIYDLALDIIKGLKEKNYSYKDFINCMHYTDPFKDYPNVISKIKEEVSKHE